jgi:N-acyl-D-aspartate/D-glutamate deacylase
MYDFLIKKGTLIDGSGRPMFQADIAIRDGVIMDIGELSHERGEQEIDATGKYIAPGFIDVNNHADTYWQLFKNPLQESLVYQGVTTIIGGNSGSSLAPLTSSETIRSIQKWTDVQKINFNWLRMDEYLSELKKRGLGVNFATLVGHGTLRRGVMQDVARTITPEDITIMDTLLERALKEGAIGMSTGLHYTHARDAGAREITALVKTVAAKKGVYATYVRDEEAGLVAAVEEALLVAKETGVTLHISHLKAVGEANWPRMGEVLELIEAKALDGIRVTFDVYPYTQTGSVLYTLFPEWITKDGRQMMMARLRDAATKETVLRDLRAKKLDYDQILISASSLSRMLSRRRISEIALLQGTTPEQTLLDFLMASDGRAIVSLEVLSQKNVKEAIQHPFSIISSNGSGYSIDHKATGELVHPRSFGTFPRVLREYVREQKLLSWEEAIHKMTGKPAGVFHLEKRGLLMKGYAADVIVFDPNTVTDNATLENPYQYASGIETVIINGTLALTKGIIIPLKRGKILTPKKGWFA